MSDITIQVRSDADLLPEPGPSRRFDQQEHGHGSADGLVVIASDAPTDGTPPRPGVRTDPLAEVVEQHADVVDLRAPRTRRPALDALPAYPEMAPVDDELVMALRPFVLSFEDYSDFNGASLFGWSGSVRGGYRVARLGQNLVVEFGDYLDGTRFLSFLGDDDVDFVASVLIDHAERRGLEPALHLVPEETARLLDRDRWILEADPDSADYVYDVTAAAELRGKPYRSLRYSFNAWEARWGSVAEIEWMELEDLRERTPEVLGLLEDWLRRRSDGAAQSEQEFRAIEHLLASSGRVAPGLSGWSGICTVDGELAAVFVNEREDYRRLCGHFLKMTDQPFGDRLYSWFFVQLCRRASDAGITWLNLQQDLGIAGLRTTKQQLRPARQLLKYTVRPVR